MLKSSLGAGAPPGRFMPVLGVGWNTGAMPPAEAAPVLAAGSKPPAPPYAGTSGPLPSPPLLSKPAGEPVPRDASSAKEYGVAAVSSFWVSFPAWCLSMMALASADSGLVFSP